MSSLKSEYCNIRLTVLGGEQAKVKIPFDSFNLTSDESFLKEIEADERKEKIIYAYTDSGVSENGRDWKPIHMESLATQVTEKMPVGYLGHIKPSEYGFEFPDPQIVWFGSCTEELSDKNKRLWIKGYLLPTADKLEKWIKTKAVDSISVYGKITYKMKGQIMDIQEIDLKSIDIARKLGEGLNSGIVGVYGEMEATYEDVREALQKAVKDAICEDPIKYGWEIPTPSTSANVLSEVKSSPYCYCYVRKMYVDENKAIINCEYNGYDNRKNLEVLYTLNKDNEPEVKSMFEVIEKVTYEKKKEEKSKSIGEMGEVKEENDMPEMNNVTIQDVKGNKALYDALRQDIASEMASESSQKLLVTRAGEMEQVCLLVGGEQTSVLETVKKIVAFNSKFVGEMSAIFAGESDEELTPDEIVNATKEAVETVNAVKEAAKVTDDEDVVEKVQKIAEDVSLIEAKEAIVDVKAEFEKLIAEVKDETVAEFVRDDFADFIEATADEIEDADTFKADASEAFKTHFKASVEKYTKRLEKVHKQGKAVGEMNAMEDLGGNFGSHTNENQDEDPDIAEARRLGYL